MEIKQLKPAVVERDAMGEWTHSEYLEYLSNVLGDNEYVTAEQWNELKRHFNIQIESIFLDESVSSEAWHKMMDDCDLSDWNPETPEGFFLIDIHFTEEDAVAVFAREIREGEVAGWKL